MVTSPRSSQLGDIVWSASVFIIALLYLAARVPEADFLLASTDQGYQMALGMAVAKGRIPGFDFITQYGPGVAFASYLGFLLTGNAIGEVLLSALGYAVTVTIAMNIVQRSAGRIFGTLAAVAMLLWFPRFYKWYYCLFPMIGIMLAQYLYVACMERRPSRACLFFWGQVVGVASLFRYDLGLEGGLFGLLALIAMHYASVWSVRRVLQDIGLFACGCLILPVAYMASIFLARDAQQLSMFVRSICDGAIDTVDFYGIAPFQFDVAAGLSGGNALALLQIIVPSTCVLCVGAGILALRSGSRGTAANGFTLFCSSLVALGIYPQALHRADLQHMLQVIYPFIVTFALLCGFFVTKVRTWTWPFIVAGGTAIAITLTVLLKLSPMSGVDLGSVLRDPVNQWQTLAKLPDSKSENPIADMAMALRRLTPSDATVFLVMSPTDMALLFFAQRYQPGIFPVYEAGMFSSRFWIRKNRAALEAFPPDYLVVLQGPNDDPAPFIPGLLREWQSQFKTTLYENRRYKLLARR